jgi:hypothetical protein
MIPNVTREIGGVNYTLRFSAGTSIAIEREFETKITDLPKVLGDDPNVTMTARLVKLCMRKDGKMLTDAEFETVLDAITIDELAELLNDAMQSASTKKPAGDTGN